MVSEGMQQRFLFILHRLEIHDRLEAWAHCAENLHRLQLGADGAGCGDDLPRPGAPPRPPDYHQLDVGIAAHLTQGSGRGVVVRSAKAVGIMMNIHPSLPRSRFWQMAHRFRTMVLEFMRA